MEKLVNGIQDSRLKSSYRVMYGIIFVPMTIVSYSCLFSPINCQVSRNALSVSVISVK